MRRRWGQLAVVLGIASVVACWLWAGRLMRLLEEERLELLLGPGYEREVTSSLRVSQ
jgi:hypothetical protein